MTAAARRKFLDSFYDGTDPGLPPAERHRQAIAAKRAYFVRLARASARARRAVASAAAELGAVTEGLADAARQLTQ